jgi:hypothetical protein
MARLKLPRCAAIRPALLFRPISRQSTASAEPERSVRDTAALFSALFRPYPPSRILSPAGRVFRCECVKELWSRGARGLRAPQ